MRRILFAGLLLTAVVGGCRSGNRQNVPEFVLTYADNQPEDYPTTRGARRFAELVEKETGGKVMIQVKAEGEFGSEEEILSQMQFGGIDFARVSLSSVADEIPRLNVLQLPFLYDDAEHMWRVLDGEIGEEFLGLFSENGLVGLSWYDAGARSFYSDSSPIRSPEDLAGLTIRVQDSRMMMDMVEMLGGNPVTFPYSDVYYAFETGRIDGAENNWPSYESLRHYEIAGYYTVDEHTRVPEIQLASGKTWETLPEEYREIIGWCARASAQYQRNIWKEQEILSRRIAIDRGCEEIVISREALEQFRLAVEPLYESYCGDDLELIDQIREQ